MRQAGSVNRWVRLTLPVLLVVSLLHFVMVKMMDANSWDLSVPIFGLLFPGEVAGLVISGPHGGTHVQDIAGEIVGIAINTCAWVLVLVLIGKLRRRMRRHDSSVLIDERRR